MSHQKLKILSANEKKRIERKLFDQFGIKNLPGRIMMRGKEKLILFTGDISDKDLRKIEDKSHIEGIGNYLGKEDPSSGDIRLSIESTQLFGEEASKNIFEISNEEDLEKWMSGSELNIETGLKGFVIMKFRDDFLGCGKASEKKIGNFIPKSRRLVLK